MVKRIAIVAFNDFTDIDLFLMWDILNRNKTDWIVEIVAAEESISSVNGITVRPQGKLSNIKNADAILFISGKKGIEKALKNPNFLPNIEIDPTRQYIGSICAGAFILNQLNLIPNRQATTHPDAQHLFESLSIESINKPLVCHKKIATAGGCLAAIYLVGWLIESLFDKNKRCETLNHILPTGQSEIFTNLIDLSIKHSKNL